MMHSFDQVAQQASDHLPGQDVPDIPIEMLMKFTEDLDSALDITLAEQPREDFMMDLFRYHQRCSTLSLSDMQSVWPHSNVQLQLFLTNNGHYISPCPTHSDSYHLKKLAIEVCEKQGRKDSCHLKVKPRAKKPRAKKPRAEARGGCISILSR
jgi:hypothetical protein